MFFCDTIKVNCKIVSKIIFTTNVADFSIVQNILRKIIISIFTLVKDESCIVIFKKQLDIVKCSNQTFQCYLNFTSL